MCRITDNEHMLLPALGPGIHYDVEQATRANGKVYHYPVAAHLPTVYAVGGIGGLSYGAATEWREQLTTLLAPEIRVWSPMRAKAFLAQTGLAIDAERYTHPLATPRGIVARDRRDCTTTDMVLIYLPTPDALTIGTYIEIGWADAARIPLAAAIHPDHPAATHPMVAALVDFWVDMTGVADVPTDAPLRALADIAKGVLCP